MGKEHELISLLRDQLRGQTKQVYPRSSGKGSGTVNHKLLGGAVCVGAALASRNPVRPALIERYTKEFIRLLEAQDERGHLCIANAIELNSPSHGQLDVAAVSHVLWLCQKYALVPLENKCIEWCQRQYFLISLGLMSQPQSESRDYSPRYLLPGFRAIRQGETALFNSGVDLWGCVIDNDNVPSLGRDLWSDQYNHGAKCLRLALDLSRGLREKIKTPPVSSSIPLPYRMYRIADGPNFLLGFPGVPASKDITAAVTYIDGVAKAYQSYDQAYLEAHERLSNGVVIEIQATEWSRANRPQS